MFSEGFRKIAVMVLQLSPEEYYDIVGEKDPLVGAGLGSAAGLATGALKGKKGQRAAKALMGGAAGSAAGALAGHMAGKALRRHQSHKLRHQVERLKVRSSPTRGGSQKTHG